LSYLHTKPTGLLVEFLAKAGLANMQSVLKPTLYEQDYDLWLQTQIAHVRAGLLGKIDLINLVEELESISNRQRRELQS
jgi:hypothetical protein